MILDNLGRTNVITRVLKRDNPFTAGDWERDGTTETEAERCDSAGKIKKGSLYKLEEARKQILLRA